MAILSRTISNETVEKINNAALTILEKKGIRFISQRALDLFREKGFKVEGDVVFFTPEQVMAAVKQAPSKFTLHGREARYDVEVGGGSPAIAPAYGPVFVCREDVMTRANHVDFENFMKLIHGSPAVNVTAPYVVAPGDVVSGDRLMYQQAACLKYTAKPTMSVTAGYEATKQAVELIKKVNSREPGDYVTVGLVNALSPLAYDETMLGALFALAEAGQPVLLASCPLEGATAPASVYGLMATVTAESLAGIVLAQLIHPGVPCIFGNTGTGTDMHYVTPSIGAPETAKIVALAKAMAAFYDIPCRSGGSLCDAKQTDYEAGSEATMVMLSTLTAGVDFVLHGAGILDSFNIIGYEKFLLDEQNVKALTAMLTEPDMDEETLGLDMVLEEPHCSQYLGTEHTFMHMNELYNPALSLHGYYDVWKNQGSPSLLSKATAAVEARLEAYTAPALSDEAAALLAPWLDVQFGA